MQGRKDLSDLANSMEFPGTNTSENMTNNEFLFQQKNEIGNFSVIVPDQEELHMQKVTIAPQAYLATEYMSNGSDIQEVDIEDESYQQYQFQNAGNYQSDKKDRNILQKRRSNQQGDPSKYTPYLEYLPNQLKKEKVLLLLNG